VKEATMAYLTILLVIHIGGAILGLGPTGAFGIMGAMAGKSGREGALALVQTTYDMQLKLVTPVAAVTQPVTGALLIFKTGRNHDFFSHTWLWIAILCYIAIMVMSYAISIPNYRKMIGLLKAGDAGQPEYERIMEQEKRLGPVFGILFVAIIVMMIWKPGD
jgi:uncharacterized membrane protein